MSNTFGSQARLFKTIFTFINILIFFSVFFKIFATCFFLFGLANEVTSSNPITIRSCALWDVDDTYGCNIDEYTIQFTSNNEIHVNCSSLYPSTLSELPEEKIEHPSRLIIRDCPLPRSGFYAVFVALGVSPAKAIVFVGDGTYPRLTDHLKYLYFLEDLSINSTYITHLDNMPSLRLLSIQKCLLYLNQGFFKNLTSLRYLELSNNNIKSIPEHIFESLSELLYLSMENNNVKSLLGAEFVGLKNLKYLSLSHNQIVEINSHVFQYLEQIEYIDLAYNRIVRLSWFLFSYSFNLLIFFF